MYLNAAMEGVEHGVSRIYVESAVVVVESVGAVVDVVSAPAAGGTLVPPVVVVAVESSGLPASAASK